MFTSCTEQDSVCLTLIWIACKIMAAPKTAFHNILKNSPLFLKNPELGISPCLYSFTEVLFNDLFWIRFQVPGVRLQNTAEKLSELDSVGTIVTEEVRFFFVSFVYHLLFFLCYLLLAWLQILLFWPFSSVRLTPLSNWIAGTVRQWAVNERICTEPVRT